MTATDRRRPLDRDHPAMLLTQHENGTAYHWVRAGDTEVCAGSAAEQREIQSQHNAGRLIDMLRELERPLTHYDIAGIREVAQGGALK